CRLYNFDQNKRDEFTVAIAETEKVVEMNLLNTTIGKRELAVSFARRFSEIDDSQVEAIRRILMEGENG
ncbi:MAG: hypothetical protein II453_06500, partial [Alphaproteobacteria bacterium]|nr:hypothetical protein [Alphaproteobacteria bacterium]